MSKVQADRTEVVQHLQMIQLVIARMNSNSFLLKRWSLVLLVAFLLYGQRDENTISLALAGLGVFSILAFWLLDSFYLWQERGYVALHNAVRIREKTEFDMRGMVHDVSYLNVVSSKTILPFYTFEVLIVLSLIIIQK